MRNFEPRSSVKLEDAVISYVDRVDGTQSIPLSEVLVIGESTNGEGPVNDDWFLSVAVHDGWFDIPTCSIGFEQFLEELSVALGYILELKLGSSITLESRVLWPPELSSEEMFWYEKQYHRLKVEQTYTDAVSSYVKRQVESPARVP